MKRLARLTAVVLTLTVLAPVLRRVAEAQGLPGVTIIHKDRDYHSRAVGGGETPAARGHARGMHPAELLTKGRGSPS